MTRYAPISNACVKCAKCVQGLGLRLKVIEQALVVHGFSDSAPASTASALRIGDVLLSANHVDAYLGSAGGCAAVLDELMRKTAVAGSDIQQAILQRKRREFVDDALIRVTVARPIVE